MTFASGLHTYSCDEDGAQENFDSRTHSDHSLRSQQGSPEKRNGDGADVPDAIPRCLSEGHFAIQLDLATADRRARDLSGLTISNSIVSWVAEARVVEHIE